MAAIKAFHIFLLLLLIIFCKSGHANRNFPTHKISLSAFDAIKDLEGCSKGNNTKGINLVKAYLQRFGYLPLPNQTRNDDDVFDAALELALKTYQQNYHIKPSGILDSTTLSAMMSPRCGVPDIINGTNHMQPRNRKGPTPAPSPHQQFELVPTISHYTLMDGYPRWPSSQMHLTYAFLPNTPSHAMAPVASAFQIWAASTQFTFSEAQDDEEADLTIGFFSGNHGDGAPFDGIGNVLAHSFAPTDGRFHYDADEQWAVGAVPGATDLESVAVHEIGHLLGLGHSEVEEAIMYPRIAPGVTKRILQPDDIDGIRALYSV